MFLRRATVAAGTLLSTVLLLFIAPAQAAQAAPAPTVAAAPPVPVAHRGASAYAPENTLAAVDKAHELHITWVENDVQRSRDGELVVVHDPTLSRTTDVEQVFPDRAPWNVADFTAAEIAQLDAGSWFDAQFAGERVPTLRQYLQKLTSTGQNLLLEIKRPDLYPGIESEILAELDRQGWLDQRHLRDKLVIQSFDAASVARIHELNPEVKTGFLGTPAVSDLSDYATYCDQVNPRYTDLTAEYVQAVQAVRGAHGRPLEVFTWTVDDASTATRLADMGVNGIISNAPDVVAGALSG